MNYIKQLIYDMRHQKMMTWVSISGTAVSIFLVMTFFMVQNLKTVKVSPELNRDRIYAGMYVDIHSIEEGWSSSGSMSYETAQRLYGDLEGVEKVSYMSGWPVTGNVMLKGKPPVSLSGSKVDGNFWEIYNFEFLEGRPFTEEECLASTRGAVLPESTARRLFGTTDVAGREINISGRPTVIYGVVRDVSPILNTTWGEIYLTLDNDERLNSNPDEVRRCMGPVKAILLYEHDTDPQTVKEQVISRYATLNSQLENSGAKIEYHGTPYNAEELGTDIYGNVTPDVAGERRQRYFIYALLILLPAVNLSSMTRGRLQHRISEIGVRRAFGARRANIIYQLLGENFVVSLAGAVIGLILSYLFMMFLSSEFFTMTTVHGSIDIRMATPTFEMLFTWKSFLVALAACFILNVLTATVPAWRASSVSPAQAISKSKI